MLQIPQRMEGQQTAIGLRTPKLEVVRVGFVGLGMRGIEAVRRFTFIPGTEIVALCDYEKGRAESCLTILDEACMPKADIYFGAEGYKALCGRNDIDLVYIATDWMHHFPVAECALQCNKHVAVEVPAAMNLEQCWSLIDLSEKKRRHCMILENCCYDWFELNTLNMVQHDVFGEIIRVQGAYIHNLEDVWSQYWKDGKDDLLGWRLKYNKENRGDIYPTHGLGPIAQVLNIHRGDRMKTLVAMDTKSVHGKKLVKQKTGKICNEFRNGDHTTTLIRTEKGKLIEIDGYKDFLFVNPKGNPKVAIDYNALFVRMVKKYNKHHKDNPLPHITPHTLRHTFCTRLASKNMNPKDLQYIMGHSNISITMNWYAHASIDTAKSEVQRLIA